MLGRMNLVVDAFWRACGYCLLPRVFVWSLVPMLLTGGLALLLGWHGWEPALDAVQAGLDAWALGASALGWLDAVGAGALRAVIAPLVVVALAVPVLAIVSVLTVTLCMARRITRLVAQRRFPALVAHAAPVSPWQSGARAMLLALVALAVLLASLPLWLLPLMALLIPPLVWGWLAGRVIGFEVLAVHASPARRQRLLLEHRGPLVAIGLLCGLLAGGASIGWWLSATALIYAPWLVLLLMGWYTLVFGFACLWTAHYLLAALAAAPAPGAADTRFGLAIC